jgi:EmrB/QacA subfamily drug resistance transporter
MDKNQKLVLIVAILASFVAFLDGSVVNVALPAISHELGGGLTTQQWVVDAYLITLGACILIAGSFSDLFGRKRILTYGLIGFGAASILCAVAPSAVFLVSARALQGIAGALLVPSSLALIISAFSGPAQGAAIGRWTAWTGIAFLVGPILGGFMVDAASWRLVFAINVLPIAVVLWLMRRLELPEQIRENTKVDVSGAILCALGLGLPVYALIEQPRYGWNSPIIIGSLIIGLTAFGVFLWHERRIKNPMLPLELFKVRNFGVGNLATTAIYAGLSSMTFLMAIFLQQVVGYKATAAGVALLPITILMFFLSSRFGALSGKYGPRLFMAAGPIIAAIGTATFLHLNQHTSYWTGILPGVIIFGIGLSVTVAPLTAAILGAIDSRQAGIGSAVNNAVARIAGLIAIAVVGLLAGTTLGPDGFHKGIILTAILLLVGGIISAVGIENLKKQPVKA